jgi:phospholipid transport system substrate-binding protein
MTLAFTSIWVRRARRLWAVPALVAMIAMPSLPIKAAEAAGAATETGAPASRFVASVGDDVIGVLRSHPADEREARAQALDKVFRQAFDVSGMARFAAGVYWRRTTEAEREKYVRLFGDYVANLYARIFAGYQGERFVVTGQRPSSEGVTAVRTEIVSEYKKTPVEFRVSRVGDDYRIVDVYVAGVSMLITKRDEFNTVLSREGMEGLMQRLKATANG